MGPCLQPVLPACSQALPTAYSQAPACSQASAYSQANARLQPTPTVIAFLAPCRYLGVTELQLGHADCAVSHYRQAAANLRLRRAGLQRAALDAQIQQLARDAADVGGASGSGSSRDAAEPASGLGGIDGADGAEEVQQIGELLDAIEERLREVQQAMQG